MARILGCERAALGFTVEPRQRLRIVGETLGQDFDGDDPVEARVAGLVDFAHAARTDEREDLVGAESCAGSEAHRLIPAVQLITTVAGVTPNTPTGVGTRKRCPSRVISYCLKTSVLQVPNSGWRIPAWKVTPVFTSTAFIVPSRPA
jgi:hypothetical protein